MKTVIEMAREAGIRDCTCGGSWRCLERFAELVRADEREKWEGQTAVEIHEAVLDEREACAQMCEKDDEMRWSGAAAAIRARSNT